MKIVWQGRFKKRKSYNSKRKQLAPRLAISEAHRSKLHIPGSITHDNDNDNDNDSDNEDTEAENLARDSAGDGDTSDDDVDDDIEDSDDAIDVSTLVNFISVLLGGYNVIPFSKL